MTGNISNVYAGIDAGTASSKLAYSDNLSTRIIARADGSDFITLREEAEIFFDEPLFSCVIAVNDSLTQRQLDTLKAKAVSSGFRNVDFIGQFQAMSLALDDESRTLFCDFGASGFRVAVIEADDVIDVDYVDVGGDLFDKLFAEYLCELRMTKFSPEILKEAKRIKHILSDNNSRLWHNINIQRNDFERLIYFPAKRTFHTVNKLLRVWKPSRFILTGGCSQIPIVREIFKGAEILPDIIAKGAGLKAKSLSKLHAKRNIADNISRIRALRAEILSVEDILTRQQKDRIYLLFKQAEGSNDNGIITLMENLLHEIKYA